MRTILFVMRVALAALLDGCASAPAAPPPGLFHDGSFAPPAARVGTDDLFTVSAEMRRFLDVDIARQLRVKGLQVGLVEALGAPRELKLEYDTARTKTAAETFASRSGNCLSLVLMTAAFAKELHLPFSYGSAYLEETWSRDGDLLFASGHVNITIGRRLADSATLRDRTAITIDFLPPADARRLRVRDIGEATVVAMYANNQAAEALARGRIDDAYAWAREALRRDAGFAGAWNTLGVVYLHHDAAAAAAPVFEHLLALEPANTRALANLAETYARLGRAADAERTRTRLAAIEPYPPFHFFQLGMAAMKKSDYARARDMFTREVDRADYSHEFHFWLGVADWQLGDVAAARRQLALAMENSSTRGQHDLYAAKLAWLQAQAAR